MLRFSIALGACVLLLSACVETSSTNQNADADSAGLPHQLKEVREQGGTCDEEDGYGCARIALTYPEFSGAPAADAINHSVRAMLASVLAGVAISDDTAEHASFEELAKVFIQDYLDYREEYPDMAGIGWEVETAGEVMFQNAKIVVVSLGTYSFTGGAHPNTYTSLSVFNISNGEQLNWSDLITDEAKLEMKARAAFQRAREEYDVDYPYDESDYFWGGPFKLSEHFGFNEQGLYCYYNAYEVAPYVMGPTDFQIPFAELEGILRLERIR
jgi:hypothetical protein